MQTIGDGASNRTETTTGSVALDVKAQDANKTDAIAFLKMNIFLGIWYAFPDILILTLTFKLKS
jgi:hypothetical protein